MGLERCEYKSPLPKAEMGKTFTLAAPARQAIMISVGVIAPAISGQTVSVSQSESDGSRCEG